MKNSYTIFTGLFIATLLLLSNASFSQTASWDYTVTGDTCSPIDMTGATNIGTGGDETGHQTNWPFTFTVYNSTYTTTNVLSWNSNGYFRFNGLVSLAARNGVIPTSDALYGQFLSYGGNTDGQILGSIFKKISGTAPSRILTVAFTYYTYYSGTSSYHADIQVNFHESSNVISVSYNNCGGSNTLANFLGMNAGDGTYGTNAGYFPTSDTCYTYTPGTIVSIDNPTSFYPSVITSNQINLSWVKNTANQNVMIAVNSTNNFGTPVTGVSYSVSQSLGTNQGTILYSGSGTSFNHINLTPNTQYYYKIWSYNGTPVYSSGVDTFATTMPVANPSNFNANAVSSSQIDLSWIKNAGNNDVLIAYNSSNTFAQPVDLQTYLVGNQIQFGQGTVIYSDSGTSYSQTNLPSGTHYFKAWSYDGSHYYSLGVMATATTVSVNNPGSFSATTASATQIDLAWTKNATNQDVMLVRNTLNNFVTPSNGYTYWVGAGLGPNAGVVIYMGSGTAYSDTGLTFNTNYFYKAYSYDVNHYYSTGLFDSATTMAPGISTFPHVQDFENTNPVSGNPACAGTYYTQLDWENVSGDDNDWIPRTGVTYGNFYSGPSGDNTTGSGKYVYAASYYDGTGACYNKTSYLVSPLFNFTLLTNPTFEFYYHMYGTAQGTLSVQVSTNGGTTWSANIWSKSGQQHFTQTAPYSLAQISLAAYASMSNIKIRIKALTSYTYRGNMAIDDIRIFNSQPMVYVSSTCSQTSEPVIHGQSNQEVMQIKISTNGDQSPISVGQFAIGTTGTNSLLDISNAKIYYTGNSSNFATTNQFGATVYSPSALFPITGSQALVQGDNYFWLTYDIPSSAVFGNNVDACCPQITVASSSYTPTITCPTGAKEIKGYQTVNAGTATAFNMPLHYYFNSACEMIYTSAEMGTAKDITKLAFYKASGTNTNSVQNVSIYIKNTTASTLASGSYSLSGYTQVYSGSFPNTAPSGWMEIPFSTPFTYDGTSNVEVLVVQLVSYYVAGYPFWRYGFTTSGNRCRYANSYNIAPSSLTLASSNRLPNIRFQYALPTLMSYSHCTTNQPDTGFVKPGDANKAVIRMDVVTNNSINPLKVKGFTINTNGTSNLSDISNAKIYYTGTSNAFAATNQFGATITTPGASLTFGNDSTTLQGGTNYFWLSYDIKSTATFDNYIDGECTAIIVDDTSRIPIVTSPIGRRQIKPYVIVGTGGASKWQAPLVYPLYNCANEMIYLSSEFGSGPKDIIKFAFEKASGANTVDSVKNVTIYMKHTNATTLSSGNHSTNGYTLVYSGSFTNNAVSGWMEVPLDVPFPYNGTQNLEVLVRQVEEVYFASYPFWAYTILTPNRCRTAYNASTVPTNLTSTNQFPNTRFEYTIPTPMVYISSETTQNDTSGVLQGGNNQMVIGIEIETNGSLNPLSATSFNINTIGTTSLTDISNAKIFYTGLNSSFAATNQFGSTVASPSSAFVINGNQTLMDGTNHFWLSYNINSTATLGNFVDGGCTSINVGGAKTPSVTAPAGKRMISGAMSGTYLIGTGGNYPTFNAAINALNLFGISGPVTFYVITGTYNEQIELTPVSGASAANTITFESLSFDSTDVILQYNASSAANYTLRLSGADRITFKNMTIKALGSIYARVVEIGNNSVWNEFSNNQIISVNSTNTGINGAGFFSTNAGAANNNHFINNYMNITANYAFYLRGTASNSQANNLIENNIINNSMYCIYAYYQNNIKIKSNIITSNYATTTNYALMMYYCDGQTEIVKNEIRLNGSTTNYGIYYFASDATSANPALMANNFITQLSGNTCYGLYYNNSTYLNVYNNNFNIISGGNSRGLFVANGSNINCVNNIINAPGGTAMYISNTGALVTSDYNDLYAPGGYVGRWGTQNRTTLAQWQSSSNKDANSISVNPLYTSGSNLHVNNFGLDNSGIPLAAITDDIDGELRNPVTPDIGADEFQINYEVSSETITAPTNGVCSGNHNIITTIKNNGSITLTSLTINWSVNSVSQSPYNWTGSLVYGATASVTLGSYNFISGNYNIFVQTSNPNGQTDQWTINDTSAISVGVYGAPTVSAGIDASICSGTNLIVSTATATNYSSLNWTSSGTGTWTNGGTISPTYTPSAADTTNGYVQLIVFANGFAGCGNVSDTMTLTLLNAPIVSFSGLASTYCPYNPPDTLIGTPVGGTFTGMGISGNIFNPSSAGAGSHTISYTVTYPVGCGGSSSHNTTVYPNTIVSLSGLGASYCVNSPSVNLLVYPPNGTLTGNGISGGGVVPGSNIAPLAGASASPSCNTGTCSTLNDLNFGTCGTQQMWITSSATNPGSTVNVTFIWPTAHIINKMTIHVGQNNTRFLTGGTIQIWNGTSWVNHTTFTQSPGVCNYDILFSAVSTTRLRIIDITVGGTQSSNVNFREIEIYEASQGYIFNPSIAGPGTHIITYSLTEANGCTFTDSDTVIVNALPTVSFSGLASTYCSDAANATLTGTPTGGTFSGTGISGNTFSPITAGAGTYSIVYSYQDANLCLGSDTQTVIVNLVPTANFTGLQASYCVDAGLVSLSGNPTGGVFSGNGISGSTFNPSVAGSGTHSITYTYTDANSCTDAYSQNVIVYSLPIANAGSNDTVLYNQPEPLSGSATGGSSNYTYSWSPASSINGSANIQNPTTINLTVTTIFTLTAVDVVSGCQDTSQVTITPFGGPLSANANANPDSICAGSSTQLSSLASGGTGVFTYAWSSAPVGFTSTAANPIVSPTATTTYTVSVTSASQNVISSVVVVVIPLPIVSFTGLATSYCADDAPATLIGNPSGGIFTGNGLNGNIFDPSTVTAGNYTINYSYTNPFGCSNDASHNTTVNAVPVATINGPDSILHGNDTSLYGSASGGSSTYSYSWGPAASIFGSTTLQNCSTIAITSPTVFTLTVTDVVTGCTNTTTKTIIPKGGPLQALASATPDSICAGISTQLNALASGGTGIFSYLWSSSPAGFSSTLINPTVSPTITTTYTVTVTSASQNTTSSVVVVVSPIPVVSFTGLATSYCANDAPATLIGSPIGGIFTGNGMTGNIFDPSTVTAGNHTINYSYANAFGCSNNINHSTTVNALPVVTISGPDTVLLGQDTTLFGSATGGSSTYSYSWGPASAIFGSTTLQNCTTTAIIFPTQFTLTVTDIVSGCSNSTTKMIIPISTGPLQALAIAGPDTICQGDTAQLNAYATGGGGTYTYLWSSNPVGFSSTLNNPIVTPTITTTYTVTVSDGITNVTSSAVLVVMQIPIVSFSGLAATYCSNQPAVTLIGAPVGGVFSGQGIVGNTFDPAIAGQGTHSITYTYTSINGCVGTDIQSVTVSTAPSANAGIDITLACGAPGQAIGSASVFGMTYSWTPTSGLNNPNISNPIAQPILTTLYTVTVSDTVAGCSATDNVLVTVTGGPTLTVSSDTIICYGSSVTLTAGGGTSYLWSTGDTTSSITATPTISNAYIVTVYAGGCADSDTIFVDVNNPVVNLGNDIFTLPSQSVILDAGVGFAAYLWSTADTTQTIIVDSVGIGPNNPTSFSVTVTDNIGCMASDTVEITFVTGIEDINKRISITLFPNPTKGIVTITVEGYSGSNINMEIADIRGRLVYKENTHFINNKYTKQIDLSTNPKGVYFIRFFNNDFNKVEKIIIQ